MPDLWHGNLGRSFQVHLDVTGSSSLHYVSVHPTVSLIITPFPGLLAQDVCFRLCDGVSMIFRNAVARCWFSGTELIQKCLVVNNSVKCVQVWSQVSLLTCKSSHKGHSVISQTSQKHIISKKHSSLCVRKIKYLTEQNGLNHKTHYRRETWSTRRHFYPVFHSDLECLLAGISLEWLHYFLITETLF